MIDATLRTDDFDWSPYPVPADFVDPGYPPGKPPRGRGWPLRMAAVIPDRQTVLAVLRVVMHNFWSLVTDPLYAAIGGATVAGSLAWSIVAASPWPSINVIATATVIAAVFGIGWGMVINNAANRAKVRELEAASAVKVEMDKLKEERIRATREKVSKRHALEIRAMQAKADEVLSRSTYQAQIDVNRREIASLRELVAQLTEQGDGYRRSFVGEVAADMVDRKMILPVAPEDIVRILPSSEEMASLIASAQRLLVVDDQEDVRSILDKAFTALGWHVLRASTCVEAIGLLAGGAPVSCVILDLGLPDGSGIDVLRSIRRRQIPTRVVIYSSTHDGPEIDAALALGADKILGKPCSFQDLKEAVGVLKPKEGRQQPDGGPDSGPPV